MGEASEEAEENGNYEIKKFHLNEQFKFRVSLYLFAHCSLLTLYYFIRH